MTALVLHVEAETFPELIAKARAVLEVVPVPATAETPAPAAAPVELPAPTPRATRTRKNPPPAAPAAVSTEAPVAAATAPALQVPAPAVAAPAASASSPVPPVATVPTVDEVRYALSEVNSAFGMAVCTALLEEYGAQRVSLVPEAKRADFIKACQAKVAAKPK